MADDSVCIGKEPCPACGSRDNLARYSDGHGFCFGCNHYEPGDPNGAGNPTTRKSSMSKDLVSGECRALPKRNLTEETCKHWRYQVGEFKGKPVQIANYCDESGAVVAQKLRFPPTAEGKKDFTFIGEPKKAGLYGQHLWRDGGKMLVITEGEIDALSVSQLQSNKWPVVSVPNGASGAAKSLAKNIEWVSKFDKVVLLFDDDEPGRAAANECAALLPPGKAFIGRIAGHKDANEALQAGDGAKVIDAIWGAKEYRPDGLVSIADVREEALKPVVIGLPWCFPTLNDATYGRRLGEVYALGAGTGIGKTDFLSQQIEHDVNKLNEQVGVIYLEQKPVETAKRVSGKAAGKRFHVPDGTWCLAELDHALAQLDGKVTFYDSYGQTEWDVVKEKIRYMAVAQGIRLFYLDHLTALADTEDEKGSLEQIMKEMAGLANGLQIIIHFVSHLTTPEGKPHEEGGRVTIRHFKGSRAIGFWSFLMIGLERNQQAENEEERKVTICRVLKDRYTGQATGLTFGLGYDANTGRLFECALPKAGEEHGFKDESQGNSDF
jgi:twinkle protein